MRVAGQRRGEPILARAVFGEKGTESVRIPRYESRNREVTDRIDRRVEHYVGEEYSHTTSSSRYEARFENRQTRVGIDHVHHETIDVVYEYAENHRMRMRRPHWAHKGQLVYVMCHRGIGNVVYDLYYPQRDEWASLQKDRVEPLSLRLPLVMGGATLLVQMQVLHGPRTFAFAIAAALTTYAAMVMRRRWYGFQLERSRVRGNRQMLELVREDSRESEDIRLRIMKRI